MIVSSARSSKLRRMPMSTSGRAPPRLVYESCVSRCRVPTCWSGGHGRGATAPKTRWVRFGDWWIGKAGDTTARPRRLAWDQLGGPDRSSAGPQDPCASHGPEPGEFAVVDAASPENCALATWVHLGAHWWSVMRNGRDYAGYDCERISRHRADHVRSALRVEIVGKKTVVVRERQPKGHHGHIRRTIWHGVHRHRKDRGSSERRRKTT